MDVGMDDLAVFMYNYAIVLTASYAVVLYGLEDRVVILGVGVLFALFWTGYFRYGVRPRLRDDESESEPEPERSDSEA